MAMVEVVLAVESFLRSMFRQAFQTRKTVTPYRSGDPEKLAAKGERKQALRSTGNRAGTCRMLQMGRGISDVGPLNRRKTTPMQILSDADASEVWRVLRHVWLDLQAWPAGSGTAEELRRKRHLWRVPGGCSVGGKMPPLRHRVQRLIDIKLRLGRCYGRYCAPKCPSG